ncbi:DUF2937 family protein [Glaciecola sp. 1036]|uniref:DUF2937 family protein n=1 Tax=Alteromonadaceae TaxID=72275 RepID=UPI003D02E6C4
MISNFFDKLLFAFLLIVAFQIPILSDQYLQFLNGYYEAVHKQVEGYKENARRHEYPDVYAMIDDFTSSHVPAIKYDGEQKLLTMQEYESLTEALDNFKSGNLFERAWYMFQPKRSESLEKVVDNFSPSIPLSPMDIIYCLLVALFFNILISWPVRFCYRKIRKSKK